MAPEQARGPVYTTCASDVWSVGIIAIQMLTGAIPYKLDLDGALASSRLMYQLASDPHFSPTWNSASMSPLAANFVEQCLVRDPQNRATVDALLLHPFLVSSHRSPSTARRSTSFRPPTNFSDLVSPRSSWAAEPSVLRTSANPGP